MKDRRFLLFSLLGFFLVLAALVIIWYLLFGIGSTNSAADIPTTGNVDQTTAQEQESSSLDLLIRGQVISYQNDLLTVDWETRTAGQIQTKRVAFYLKPEMDVFCWPKEGTTVEGANFELKNAYFPVDKNSFLSQPNQTHQPLNQVASYLETKPYIFALLALPHTEETELVTQPLKQLVILGCNE